MSGQHLNAQSYYRLDDAGGCNLRDLSRPLVVNCSGVCVFDRPFRSQQQHGRHDFYLMYLVCGALDAWTGTTAHSLQAGDVIFYPPETYYAYQLAGTEKMAYLWVHFTGSDAENLLTGHGLEMARVYHIGHAAELSEAIEGIHRLFITRPAFFLEEAAARLNVLLLHIARSVRPPESAFSTDRFQASLNYLNRHYTQAIRLETLAEMEYLSASRYSALFRQIIGCSPQQYLLELRLKNARELLHSTDLSIAEVARSVGYEDALYFSRLFRRHTGQPPSAYRAGR